MKKAIVFISLVQTVSGYGQHVNPQDLLLKDSRFDIVETGTSVSGRGQVVPSITLKNVSPSHLETVALLAVGVKNDGSIELIIFTQVVRRVRISSGTNVVLAAIGWRSPQFQLLGAVTELKKEASILELMRHWTELSLLYQSDRIEKEQTPH